MRKRCDLIVVTQNIKKWVIISKKSLLVFVPVSLPKRNSMLYFKIMSFNCPLISP